MYHLIRPLLFALDPETAHGLSLYGLGVAQRSGFAHRIATPPEPLPAQVLGIDFPNPVGLAAGLDKNARYLDALAALGFGFIEVGTVTPRPQAGNPAPRMFRLPSYEAVINRLGFNNAGIDALVRNVEHSSYRGVLGINLGKNRDTPNDKAFEDYQVCMRRAYALASYLTINISSPNTTGLRELQNKENLHGFVSRLREEQEALAGRHGRRVPMLLKIAPDLDQSQMDTIAGVVTQTGIDGLVCTNTTLDRSGVQGAPNAQQEGGLSGRPLRQAALQVLAGMRERVGPSMAIIGVGGILDGEDAARRMAAGADLVQLYTGMIYRGPRLIGDCVDAIRRAPGSTAA